MLLHVISASFLFFGQSLRPMDVSIILLTPSPTDERFGCFWAAAAAKLLQSCPTLCDPIDGSPSGSSIPGILQARTLEWVVISFSKA